MGSTDDRERPPGRGSRLLAAAWAALIGIPSLLAMTPPATAVIESPFWEFVFDNPNGLATRAMGIALLGALGITLPRVLGPLGLREMMKRSMGLSRSSFEEDVIQSPSSNVITLTAALGLLSWAFAIAYAAGAWQSMSGLRLLLLSSPVLLSGGIIVRDLVRSAMDWRRAAIQTHHIYGALKSAYRRNSADQAGSWFSRLKDRLAGRRRLSFTSDGGTEVELGVRTSIGFYGTSTALTIDLGDAVPKDLLLGPERLWAPRLGKDVEVGSAEFDEKTEIRGDRADLAAILTKGVTRRVSEAIKRGGFQLREGVVRVRIGTANRLDDATERGQDLVDLALQLRLSPQERPQRYLRAVRTQRWPSLALAALEGLIERFRESPETATAVSEVLQDGLKGEPGRAEMVVLAAAISPKNSLDVLLDVARKRWTSEAAAMRALELAAVQLPSKSAMKVLMAGLRRGENTEDEPSQRRALELLTDKLPADELHPILMRHACRARSVPSEETRAHWADALRKTGGPGLEEEVQRCLTEGYGGEELEIAGPAILLETLALVGRSQTLRFLADWRESQPALPPLYDKAVTRAIAAIRRRSGDVNLGSLAVVEDPQQAGGLSRATEEGALSEASESSEPEASASVRARRPKQRN